MFGDRIRLFSILAHLSFLILAVGLFSFQVLRYEHYRSLSLKNAIRIVPIEASRGAVYDRNGRPLAKDEISFNLVIIPQETGKIDEALAKLSTIAGIDKKELSKNYKRNYQLPFVPVKLASNISAEKAFYIEEKLPYVPGALIYSEPRRMYPGRAVGSHIIGYVGRIAEEEFKTLKYYGYKIQDLVGKSGIEKYYDVYLKGEDGGTQIEVDSRSREVKRLGFKQPRKGKDIRLTVDMELQHFLDMLLIECKGACIVMDARTGAILGLSSSPGFDPNLFITGTDREKTSLLNDRGNPLLNRAVACSYPPGSTFKIIVAVAGIASGLIRESTNFNCTGTYNLGKSTFRCWRETGHGYQNIIEALIHSCNIFFYNAGRTLGAEGIYRYAIQLGLGSLTMIDLPGEIKGIVPGPLWKRFVLKKPWYEGDTVNYSIGQGYLLVTPIQMLRAVTIVANEGYCPTPYLVEEIEGRRLSHRKPYVVGLKSEAFKVVKKGMCAAVNDPTGTGQNARWDEVSISGKTGTAQPGTYGDTHAWFVGYLPSDNPKISFVVFLEHGGQGGGAAAYMVKLIATYLKENGFLND